MPARFEFYKTSAGAEVVREEVRDAFPPGSVGRVALGALMTRIQNDQVLPSDVKALQGRHARGILEARLTVERRVYRLYYTRVDNEHFELLALKFAQKGSRGAQEAAIRVAISRLADWRTR